jgi:hypothetical protein
LGGGIPAIEITKDMAGDMTYGSDESEYQEGGGSVGNVGGARRRNNVPQQQQQQQQQQQHHQQQQQQQQQQHHQQQVSECLPVFVSERIVCVIQSCTLVASAWSSTILSSF